jgi:hypothetical protein
MATIIASKTVTVNAAFLQEIKDVNLELKRLFESVEHFCSRPISIHGSSKKFVELLNELRDQLALHFALEEAFGYFDDPEHVEPWISDRADSIRGEHRYLYMAICELVEYAEYLYSQGNWANLATKMPAKFNGFSQKFKQHEWREQELILQAYTQDIGVGD